MWEMCSYSALSRSNIIRVYKSVQNRGLLKWWYEERKADSFYFSVEKNEGKIKNLKLRIYI